VAAGQGFVAALATLRAKDGEPRALLEGYAQIYAEVLRQDRMCLCGMLAAEHATLPRPMRSALNAYFDANERWLSEVLEQGRASGALRFGGTAVDEARALVAALEGAMLVARAYGEPARFESAAARVLASL
jgi:TetR/AcrR family transcriptional repressor of nem operon